MPTSAAGSKPCYQIDSFKRPNAGCARPFLPVFSRGFTLLELIVVIAIMALATAGVGFAMRDSGEAALEREADRLAVLLDAARAQSRASGATVRWRVTPEGFVFDGLPVNSLPSGWLNAGVSAQPFTADGRAGNVLLLGPDPIIAAQQVLLTMDGPPARSLRIGTDGLRPFAVVAP